MSSYAFDNAVVLASTDRFTSLQHCYDPISVTRLGALGIRPGWRCLEIGTGAGSVANWLGEQVGDGGSVVATDIDVGLVGETADNVEVRSHDIVRDPLPEAAFDLVHARLVLLHLPERRRALHRIWHALKPGGQLLLEDFDCTWMPVLSAPDAASVRLFTKVVDGIHELLQRAGADIAWGSNAYQVLVDTGYVDLDVRGYSELWRGGSIGAQLHRANAQQTAERLVRLGLATAGEIERFVTLIEDPRFAVSSYLLLSTSGRRPGEPVVDAAD
ncbi:MAG: class I SAM-dependent methyltransferase [Nocardioidaceae bacterium]